MSNFTSFNVNGTDASINIDVDVDVKYDISSANFNIGDDRGNVIVQFEDGHIKTQNFNSSAAVCITNDYTTATLNIADEHGNVIAQFKDGHIKTQNFNSSNISSINIPMFLEKFKGKTLGIIGDSISTFGGYLPSDIDGYDGSTYAKYYPTGDVNTVDKTWWYKVATALGINPETEVSNCAWSGSRVTGDSSSTTYAYAGCSTRRISDLTLRLNGNDPDIIICYISCNDWSGNISVGTWSTSDAVPSDGTISTLREAYALMLYKIHTTYPDSRVFCCTNLDDTSRDRTNGWPSNNTNGVSTDEWNSNIIEIARAMGCDVINLHECGMNWANMSSYCVDSGLHPNDAGHTLMARKIVAELFAKY